MFSHVLLKVKEWQDTTRQNVQKHFFVETIAGRRRYWLKEELLSEKSHTLRAAINTPVQGSAADIMTNTMIQLHFDQKLRELDFRQLLQKPAGAVSTAAVAFDESLLWSVEELAPLPRSLRLRRSVADLDDLDDIDLTVLNDLAV